MALVAGVVGLATSAVGIGLSTSNAQSQASNSQAWAAQSASYAQQEGAINTSIAGYEQQENAQRQQAMVLSNQRQQTENIRNSQKAQALGLSTAVNQGAQFGSGLQGGQSAAKDQENYNALGFSQNLQIGQNLFGLSNNISSQKINLYGVQTSEAQAKAQYQGTQAGLQGQAAFDTGLTSLGKDLVGGAGTLGKLFPSTPSSSGYSSASFGTLNSTDPGDI